MSVALNLRVAFGLTSLSRVHLKGILLIWQASEFAQ